MSITSRLISSFNDWKVKKGSHPLETVHVQSQTPVMGLTREVSDHQRLMASELITEANKDQLMT